MSCEKCVYCPKCKERPENGGGCSDFKDRELFVELPFRVNQIIFFLCNETKKFPVVIDGEPYVKLVTETKIASTVFSGDILSEYIETVLCGQKKTAPKYFATKKEAAQALADMKNKEITEAIK